MGGTEDGGGRWLPLDGTVDSEVGHPASEDRQGLLQLGACERRSEAEVDTGAFRNNFKCNI